MKPLPVKEFALLLGLFFSGMIVCTTPYQRESALGGFSDTPYGNNTWLVSFRGNGYTGKGQVQDFVMLRASELALENGYSHFIVVDAKSGHEVVNIQTYPGTVQTQGTMRRQGNYYNYQESSTYSAPQSVQLQKHESSMIIKIGSNEEFFFKGIDARQTRNRLASRYGIP